MNNLRYMINKIISGHFSNVSPSIELNVKHFLSECTNFKSHGLHFVVFNGIDTYQLTGKILEVIRILSLINRLIRPIKKICRIAIMQNMKNINRKICRIPNFCMRSQLVEENINIQ